MTNFERASLRRPDVVTQVEPDANIGDRIVAWACAIGIVVLVGLTILGKVAA